MRRSATRRVAASLASGAVGWSVGSACSRSGGALPDADGGEWTPMRAEWLPLQVTHPAAAAAAGGLGVSRWPNYDELPLPCS